MTRRQVIGTRTTILVEAKANARWSLDAVHDQLAHGRRFRVLNFVDDVTRECLAAIPDTSISGWRVVRELAVLIPWPGKPGLIASDNGTEFASNAVLSFAPECGLDWHFIAPEQSEERIASRNPIASRCRTASARASTTGCLMNC